MARIQECDECGNPTTTKGGMCDDCRAENPEAGVSERDVETALGMLQERDLAASFGEALIEAAKIDDDAVPGPDFSVERTETFEEIGLLTTDRGVRITLANGQRFLLTVQEDRR